MQREDYPLIADESQTKRFSEVSIAFLKRKRAEGVISGGKGASEHKKIAFQLNCELTRVSVSTQHVNIQISCVLYFLELVFQQQAQERNQF